MSYIHSRNDTIVALKVAKDTKSFYSFRRMLLFQEWLELFCTGGVQYKKFQLTIPI